MDIEAELKMRGHIYDLVMTGNYYITQEEWDELAGEYVDLFYDRYQDMVEILELPALPLIFNPKKKHFSFLPSFLAKASTEELLKYRQVFRQRFEEVFGLRDSIGMDLPYNEGYASDDIEDDDDDYDYDESDEEDDEDFDDEEEFPALPYRVPNETYIESMIDTLTGLTEKPAIMDEYGWIEDRKSIFFKDLSCLCEDYKLSLLPVGFNAKGIPYFKATEPEIENFKKLCVERRSIEKLRETMLKEEREKAHALNKQFDASAVYKRAMRILEKRQKSWEKENEDYEFPSAVEEYSEEFWSEDNDDRLFLLMVENAEMADGPPGSHDTTDREIKIRPFLYEFSLH